MRKEKKDTFIKTDFDLILDAAKKAKSSGAKTISLVSAVGVKRGIFKYLHGYQRKSRK